MITFDQERPFDGPQVESMLDASFGPERFKKSSYSIRNDNASIQELSIIVRKDGLLAGSVRFFPVRIHDMIMGSDTDALFLGPLAVHPAVQGLGIGRTIMQKAMANVRAAGHKRVLLVGDVNFYGRFGFESVLPSYITLPSGKERRLLIAKPATVSALPAVGKILPGWGMAPEQISHGSYPGLVPAA